MGAHGYAGKVTADYAGVLALSGEECAIRVGNTLGICATSWLVEDSDGNEYDVGDYFPDSRRALAAQERDDQSLAQQSQTREIQEAEALMEQILKRAHAVSAAMINVD